MRKKGEDLETREQGVEGGRVEDTGAWKKGELKTRGHGAEGEGRFGDTGA